MIERSWEKHTLSIISIRCCHSYHENNHNSPLFCWLANGFAIGLCAIERLETLISNVIYNYTFLLFIYMKNKTVKNNVNYSKKFFFIVVLDLSFFRTRARQNSMEIIWFHRRVHALSSCIKIRNFQCLT